MIKLKSIISFLEDQTGNRISGNYGGEVIIKKVLFFQRNMEMDSNNLYLAKETDDLLLNNNENLLLVVKSDYVNRNALQINTEKSIQEVYQIICNFMFEKYKLYETKYSLYNSLYKSNNFNEILNVSEGYLNNPIFILDTGYRIIGCSTAASTIQTYTKKYRDESYLLTDIINFMKRDKCIDNIYNSETAFLQTADKNFIFCGIRINNVTVAYICILEENREFIDDDLEITNDLAQVISIQMQKENLFIDSSGLEEEYYLMDLLKNRIDNMEDVKQRLNNIGFKIYKKISLIIIPYSQVYRDYRHNFGLKQLMNTGKNILKNCISAYNEEKIIFMVSGEDKNVISQEIKEEFISFLRFNNLKAGVSLV